MFEALVHSEYCESSALAQYGHLDWEDSNTLEDLIQSDFDAFSDDANTGKLLQSILEYGKWYDPKDAAGFQYGENYWHHQSDDMGHRDIGDHWDFIREAVLRHGHAVDFVRERPEGIEFDAIAAYQKLMALLPDSVEVMPKDTILWRARLNRRETLDELRAPPPESARAGRGNLQGQPVLYLARNDRTVVYEVRPGRGQEVTLAEFKTVRELRLCSLSGQHEYCSPFADLERFQHLRDVSQTRFALGADLARPVVPGQENKDYLPTQFLSNVIRQLGFDGIAYPSSQIGQTVRDTPANILLFDPSAAAPKGTLKHVTVSTVDYTFADTPKSVW
ncbi:MAG: RES family NAD+ phosphorylase [Planctomycetes bacterium]|nr:RES family NAD+ phosphorylase [Planctomycetota bacterium]